MKDNGKLIRELRKVVGRKYVYTDNLNKEPFSKGWRYGEGNALAVIKPGILIELWNVLKICVNEEMIIIMQAANTGLTGGSTPYGSGYDRPIIIINTMRSDDIH